MAKRMVPLADRIGLAGMAGGLLTVDGFSGAIFESASLLVSGAPGCACGLALAVLSRGALVGLGVDLAGASAACSSLAGGPVGTSGSGFNSTRNG